MSDNGERLELLSVRSAGDGNWGWPDCLVLTLRNEKGETMEATVGVSQWRNLETGQSYSPR